MIFKTEVYVNWNMDNLSLNKYDKFKKENNLPSMVEIPDYVTENVGLNNLDLLNERINNWLRNTYGFEPKIFRLK